ncbi:MAG: alpha/beta hydrolase [Phycisphaeraceae bacterium]
MGLLILFFAAVSIIIAIATMTLVYSLRHPPRLTYGVALAHHLPTEPSELGLQGEECSFVLEDNSRAPGWVIRGQKADGPTVIISHGWSDSRYGSLTRAPLLAPHASRIIVYDLRGHGDHTSPRCTLTALEPEDLLTIMRQVDDGSPFVLMGQSMGAGVAIVAGAKGEAGLGSSGPSLRISGVIVEAAYREMMEPVAGLLRNNHWPAQPTVWLADQHLRFWLGVEHGHHRRVNGHDRAMHAAKLTCPLLVLHGEDDRCSLASSAKAIAEAAPRGTLVMFPGQGHNNLAIADPERYAAALAEFFAKL